MNILIIGLGVIGTTYGYLFHKAGSKLEYTEQPYDMLEWIWLHMAINAAVVSVAGKYGSIDDTAMNYGPTNCPHSCPRR